MYIDDFSVITPKDKVDAYFRMLSDLFQKLGLSMNPDKKTPPCKSLICLGIEINLADKTLKSAPEKLHSIYNMCFQVHQKKFLSKKIFQSLLDKLLARSFINRILNTFRANSHKNRIKLDQDFYKDVQWFLKMLPAYNGITFFDKQTHCKAGNSPPRCFLNRFGSHMEE